MYLSRLILNIDNRRVWQEIAKPYEMHRTIMKAFPQVETHENPREKYNVLFRADVDERNRRTVVFVQSTIQPDWSFLLTIYEYLCLSNDKQNPACKSIETTINSLRKDQILKFRLRANPTKRIGRDTKYDGALKGKRVGLLREEEQIEWLQSKGEKGGFTLIENRQASECVGFPVYRVSIQKEGKLENRKKDNEKKQTTTHLAARFDGVLKITDVDAFRSSLIKGIGPGKAFGFGLLSIAPNRR